MSGNSSTNTFAKATVSLAEIQQIFPRAGLRWPTRSGRKNTIKPMNGNIHRVNHVYRAMLKQAILDDETDTEFDDEHIHDGKVRRWRVNGYLTAMIGAGIGNIHLLHTKSFVDFFQAVKEEEDWTRGCYGLSLYNVCILFTEILRARVGFREQKPTGNFAGSTCTTAMFADRFLWELEQQMKGVKFEVYKEKEDGEELVLSGLLSNLAESGFGELLDQWRICESGILAGIHRIKVKEGDDSDMEEEEMEM
jgi:hypothetical protein